MTNIELHSIVLLIGPSGSGKSTLATKIFPRYEIVSSDDIRAELCGDFRVQTHNDDVFAEVHRRVEHRIYMGQRVVVDATNLKQRDRRYFIDLAKKYGVKLYYLVVNRSIEEKLATGGWRLEVNGLIERHDNTFKSNLREILAGDGFATVILNDQPFAVTQRGDLETNLRTNRYDRVMAVGDIHGCPDDATAAARVADAEGAFTIYLGDIIDYGDRNLDAFWFVYERVVQGKAVMVWGNHERKLDMWIRADFGANYRGTISHGMKKTIDEIKRLSNRTKFRAAWCAMESLSSQHYVIGDLLFTHGAATPELWNIHSHRPLVRTVNTVNWLILDKLIETSPQTTTDIRLDCMIGLIVFLQVRLQLLDMISDLGLSHLNIEIIREGAQCFLTLVQVKVVNSAISSITSKENK